MGMGMGRRGLEGEDVVGWGRGDYLAKRLME